MNNKINISYPRTNYLKLNTAIKNLIDRNLTEFLNYGSDTIGYLPYEIDITYKRYSYNNYLSFVFYISLYTGGAHPNNTIETINYNTKENKLVDINTLHSKNKGILNNLSELTREILSKNIDYQNNNIMLDMLIEGTKPNTNNFRNFVFTKDGLLILFEPYQIAPYSSGSKEVIIPYNKL